MGILNVTPDSFSDGGLCLEPDDALRQAETLLAAGADLLDIGGESTRPGGAPVSQDEELARVIPVISRLTQLGCALSIDTTKPEVARAALASGADIVNDINGLQGWPGMAEVVAAASAGLILMHNARLYRTSRTGPPQSLAADMIAFLQRSVSLAISAGIAPAQLAVDPGIGFGVSPEESVVMLQQLDVLKDLGLPILVGPSRKRFIGELLDAPVGQRQYGTAAAVTWAIASGADFVRVHDVREMRDVVRVADALARRPVERTEG
jgi:dihydropteroate synthase